MGPRASAGERHPLRQVLILFLTGTSHVHSVLRWCDQEDRGMSTQDLLVKCRRGGEESLGILLRRHPMVGVARTGDDHKPLGKRVLGAAHRGCCVTISTVPDAERSARTDTGSALHAHTRTRRSNVSHEGQRQRRSHRERQRRSHREERQRRSHRAREKRSH